MFKTGLEFYTKVVEGKSSQSRWLFYVLTSIIAALILFVLCNLEPNDRIDTGYFVLEYNKEHFLLVDMKRFGLSHESIVRWKILEFSTLFLLALCAVWLSHRFLMAQYLTDALSGVRQELMGTWQLNLQKYVTGEGARDLRVKVRFGETEAKKRQLSP